jgi:hypothetical protein
MAIPITQREKVGNLIRRANVEMNHANPYEFGRAVGIWETLRALYGDDPDLDEFERIYPSRRADPTPKEPDLDDQIFLLERYGNLPERF